MTPRRQIWITAGTLGLVALPTFTLAQDASRVQPAAYRVVLDNAQVRVLEYTSRPGMGVCGSGMHTHPAHLTVLLTPARVRITENGRTFIKENKAGDTFWSGPVRHEVENIGGSGARALIIETKSAGHGR